jgi:hypothetical protein
VKLGIDRVPLSQITGIHSSDQTTENNETKDDAFHPMRSFNFRSIKKAIFVPRIVAPYFHPQK